MDRHYENGFAVLTTHVQGGRGGQGCEGGRAILGCRWAGLGWWVIAIGV
jgi:hypothetical protein